MTDSGTKQELNDLTTPTTEEQYLDMMTKAVNDGDDAELNRLMAMELKFSTSDAEGEEVKVDEAGDEPAKETKTDDANAVVKEEKPVETPAVVADDKNAEPRVTEGNPAPVVAADEDKIKALEAELHRVKSETGRINSMQSKISQLESQLRLSEAARKAAVPATPKTSDEDKKINERLQELRAVDPGTADLLEAIQRRFDQQLAEQTAAVPSRFAEELDASQRTANLQAELNKVMEVHPEFTDITKHVSWTAWKARLTPEQRAWAESDRAEHVIVAVNEFKKAHGLAAQEQAAPPVVAPAVETPAPVVPEVDPAKLARERKLNAAPTSKESSIKSESVFDPDAAFKEVYNNTLKEIGAI